LWVGALDKARAKFALEVGQAFADHGLGQTEAPGGLADRSRLGHR
jgi:hypothetical protein